VPTVLVSNDDLTVLGSPEIVELLVDIGPTGQRGSKVFAGIGDPNSPGVLDGQTILLNDLYINTSPGSNYGYLYQYISQPGGSTWAQILKMNPTLYSKKFSTTYTAGEATITIPIANITSLTSLTADNFNIQYSIAHTDQVSSSISSIAVVGTDLVIDFKGLEYSGSWSSLSGPVTTHIFISIMI